MTDISPPQKTQKVFELTRGEINALAILKRSGYAFPATTDVAVIRKMISDIWSIVKKGEPFPEEENAP